MRHASIVGCLALLATAGCSVGGSAPSFPRDPILVAPLRPGDSSGRTVYTADDPLEPRAEASRFLPLYAWAYHPDSRGRAVTVALRRVTGRGTIDCGTTDAHTHDVMFGMSGHGTAEDFHLEFDSGSDESWLTGEGCVDEEGYFRPGRYWLSLEVEDRDGTASYKIVLR